MKIPEELLHKSRVKVSGIYQITNTVNGKRYVGSSDHLYIRHNCHLRYLSRGTHSNPKLQNSWNKYGGENFSFTVLEYAHPELIRDKEQEYINRLDPEFNISKVVGYPNTPKAGTPEAKLRSQKNMEARRKSEWIGSKELHEIMSSKLKDRWEDENYRTQRSADTKALWENPEYRDNLSEVHKKIKDEDREKIKFLVKNGHSPYKLAGVYGVHRITIQRIAKEA